MTDVLTSVWGFVKQTIGGNRNTWGAILNTNFDGVEAGLAGQLSKAVTGGSVTLTSTERRNRILSFTGTLGSAQAVVVSNLVGVWLVKNGTTGAFALSMKTAAGAAVAIPQGSYAMVWCDGNDVVSVGPSSLLFSTQFQLPDGTVALPGAAFLNDTDTGVRRAGYSAGTLGTNPFTTTNGSAVVTVAHTAHGMATNDYAFFSGSAAVGGITPDGLYPVTVTGANAYTITHSAVATSGATGGGASVLYKYMIALATAGNAIALTANGADVAHISPYGVIWTGSVYVSSAAKFGGNVIAAGAMSILGALSGAAATFTGLITGATATLSGLLTLSSTSHMSMAGGTTAQRPGSPNAKDFRVNTDTGFLELYINGAWSAFESGKLPRGYIDGCITGNGDGAGGGDQTNDITISAGVCRDSTNTVNITCAALTKQLDANWVAGTNQGMRNSAAGIANATYHIYAVMKADGTQDYYAHTSTTIATVLAALQLETGGSAYIYARHIWSIVRISAAIRVYTQVGNTCRWKTPTLDLSTTTLSTASVTFDLSATGGVPIGLVVAAKLNTLTSHASGSAVYLRALADTDTAPSLTAAPLANSGEGSATSSNANFVEVFTDTSGQVAARALAASTTFRGVVVSFGHPRGRDA